MHIGIVKQEKGVLQLSHFNFFFILKTPEEARQGRIWVRMGGGVGVSIPQMEQVPLKVGSLLLTRPCIGRKEIETYK